MKVETLYYRNRKHLNNAVLCNPMVHTIRARRNKPSDVRQHSIVRPELELRRVPPSLFPECACDEKVAPNVVTVGNNVV